MVSYDCPEARRLLIGYHLRQYIPFLWHLLN